MRSLFSIIFFTISISALAQVTADFNLPTEVCLEEQFQLANTSIDGDTYEWDFCGEEFNSLPIESELANIDGATDVKGNYLYYDSISSEYYFFNTNDNGRLFRTNLGSDLSLPYQTTELTFSSGSLDRPQAIKIIKNENDSNFYGYVGSRINGYGISRINFGSDIGNNEVSIDNLGTFGEGNVQIRDIKVYIENGEYFLLGLNLNASRFFLVKYGNSLSNTPYDTITTNSFPNISLSNGFDLVEKDGDIIAFIVGLSSNNIIRLNFGASIETGFVFEKEYDDSDFPSNLNRLSRIKFQEDFGNYYAILTQFDAGNPTLTIDFKNLHLDSIPTDLQYSNLHFSELSGGYINGDYKYFGVNGQKLYSINYSSDCGESIKSSTIANPIVSYNLQGGPKIKLKAISAAGEKSSIKKSLNVTGDIAPIGNIDLNSNYCIANLIEFNFNTTADLATYNWNFGDGNTSTAVSPTHQYAVEGDYFISLEVVSTAGCSNIFYDTLTILPEPQPEFSTASTEYCTFESINFNNITPFDFGENVDWSWDFNGEGSSSEENPSFIFESSGTKTITVEANVLGCIENFQSTLEITDGPQPDFEYDKNCLGEVVQFTNLSTGTNITGYQWDFGNGETSTEENPQVTYNNAGDFTVELRVSNASGCENITTQNIQIFDQVVDNIYSTESIENLPFDLGVDWNNDFDSIQNLSFQWDINGDIQTTDTAIYILGQGIYVVNLEVVTASGCLFSDQRTIEIKASEKPTPNFNLPVSVCLEEQLELENTSVNSNNYLWDFCDGEFSTVGTEQILTSLPGSNNVRGLSLYYDTLNSVYYFFHTNLSNGSVYRTVMGSDLLGSYITSELTFSGAVLDNPQAIKIIKDNTTGNYYGFVGSGTNGFGISRINFGTNLANSSVTVDNLGTFDEGNVQIRDLKVYKEGGEYYLLGLNLNNSRFFLVKYGNSLGNTPYDIISGSSIPKISLANGFDIVEKEGEKIVYVVGLSSNNIVRLNFGSSIETGFTFEEEYTDADFPSTLSRLSRIRIQEDFGNYYAIVSQFDSGNPTLTLDLKNLSLDSTVVDLGYSNSHFSELSGGYFSGGYNYFGVKDEQLYSVKFDSECGSPLATSTEANTFLSYNSSGIKSIKMKALDAMGNSSSITKEITVTDNQAPEISFNVGANLCINNPIQFNSESNAEIIAYNWNFGDGESSTEANPEHLFSSAGDYVVQLSVTDTAGCNNLFQDSITIYAEPQPNFQVTAQGSLCSQKPVIFENLSNLPTDAVFLWEFGDGTSSTDENPDHIYAEAGEYIINFQIEMAGCTVEKTDTITVNPGPLVDFNYSDDCYGQVLNFENISAGDFLQNFQWSFGDGTQSTQTNPKHRYDSAGTYDVQLSAFTSNGCDYTFQQQVIVHPVATVAFEAEVACAEQPVQFTEQVALQQSNITDYLWDFGISGTISDRSTEANPQFVFPTAGTFEVQLQVTTADGCTSTASQVVVVQALPQPSFTYEKNCLFNPILFSPDNTDNISSHFWELQTPTGEVLFSAQSENFSYTFETPGNYQLRYRQENENLCSNTITETVEILPLPEPDFEVGNLCSNQNISFENLTDLKGNNLEKYNWTIDGEVISTDFRPQYTFQNSGDFLLGLQVETESGCIQSISKTISVSESPTAFFDLEQTLAAFPYTLSLNAEEFLVSSIDNLDDQDTNIADRTNPTSSSGTEGLVSPLGIKGRWTLNADTISTSPELNYTIEQEGTYLLGLIVTNEAGCTASHYEQIRIRKPNLDVALSNLRITQDQEFTSFVLNISNKGTLVPQSLNLDIDLGSYSITETIAEPLLPEKSRNVALSIKLTEEQLRGLAKICIQAIPHNAVAAESNVSNNRVCTNLESGLKVMDIYPNPAATEFTLPMIIPENASVTLSLEQSNGQNVKTLSYDLEAGYNEIQINRDNLKAGIYFLRIRYQGEEIVKKIIFQ